MAAAGVQMAILLLLGLSALALTPTAVEGHRQLRMHRRRLIQVSSASSSSGDLSMQHAHTIKHRIVQQVISTLPKSGYCAEDEPGAPAPFNATGTNITTCVAFHAAPEPLIKVPADTATVKYGLLQGTGPYSLYDRDNKGTPLSAAAAAPLTADAVSKVWSRLVVKGEVDASGQVTSFVPVVYVPASAVLSEYVNSQYVSTLTNGGSPPAGVPATSWARWSFLSNVTETGFLIGSFDNLYWSVKDAEGKCQPALCFDPTRTSAACQYFSKLYSENITMTWDSRVFFPGVSGSQVGVFLSNTTFTSYVPTTIPAANGFLNPYTFVPKDYVGFNVGNPFNLPFQFSGAFSSVPNSTSIEYCVQ